MQLAPSPRYPSSRAGRYPGAGPFALSPSKGHTNGPYSVVPAQAGTSPSATGISLDARPTPVPRRGESRLARPATAGTGAEGPFVLREIEGRTGGRRPHRALPPASTVIPAQAGIQRGGVAREREATAIQQFRD